MLYRQDEEVTRLEGKSRLQKADAPRKAQSKYRLYRCPERTRLRPCRSVTIDASRTLNEALIDRKVHGIPMPERHDVSPSLHSPTLLRHHELASRKVFSRFGQQNRGLERKDMLAFQILMQAM